MDKSKEIEEMFDDKPTKNINKSPDALINQIKGIIPEEHVDNDIISIDYNVEPKFKESNNKFYEELEYTLEDILINIRLISKIEIGNKLIQNGKYINIDNNYFPSIMRRYYKIDRTKTIQFINFIVNKAIEYVDNNIKYDEHKLLILRLTNELRNANSGLYNLKQTYEADKLIQAEIDVIIDNIRLKVEYVAKVYKL